MLKKQNWWIGFVLNILTLGLIVFIFGKKLSVYQKNAWYTNIYYWILGIICGFFPALIMFFIFNVQISILVSEKLDVPLKKIYTLPYIWVLGIIIPIIGWITLILLFIYTHLWYFISIMQGKVEKYI